MSGNGVQSKRERTTRMGMFIILALTSEGFILGIVALIMVFKGIDISPAATILGGVMNVIMVAVGAIASGSLGLVAGDTARPSGSTNVSWKPPTYSVNGATVSVGPEDEAPPT